MTARDLYDHALVELNKLEAPSLLLEEYNYFMNKAVQQYVNLTYAKLEVDQQSTDDIRVLKTSAILKAKKLSEKYSDDEDFGNGLFMTSYYADLPNDYMHVLNCIIEYTVQASNFKCYEVGKKVYFNVKRLSPDLYAQILNNAYLRPSYKRPYYYINNVNTSTTLPTNVELDESILSASNTSASNTDKAGYYTALSAYYNALDTYNKNESNENKEALKNASNALEAAKAKIYNPQLVDSETERGDRTANSSTARLEVRFGRDDTVFKPTKIYIDYLKAPMYIRLTQEQIESTLDTSQVLEFPDYVCYEICNIFTRLLMENSSDPRLQTNMPLNNTIAPPAALQAAQQQAIQ